MLSCRHPWQNFDEIQTLWRLGRFDRPPMPEKISKEAENFLNATFAISPDERPSALELMDHEFCIYDVENFDFRAYKEAAIIRKRELDEKEEEEEEDSEDDEGIFTKLTIDDSEEDYEVNADEVQSEINPVSS
jgi:serine/threonine protein kinase